MVGGIQPRHDRSAFHNLFSAADACGVKRLSQYSRSKPTKSLENLKLQLSGQNTPVQSPSCIVAALCLDFITSLCSPLTDKVGGLLLCTDSKHLKQRLTGTDMDGNIKQEGKETGARVQLQFTDVTLSPGRCLGLRFTRMDQ
ncbi:unnamed protein product [Pleuronectes platessa]|uniref:Uncharacterized protein n=1 Tax=Pleuronectes platessa TaxID=8262 RepID=A0A9N7Z477_PLEPL|nr:unnamed protein product [Pleuronectes platessa]